MSVRLILIQLQYCCYDAWNRECCNSDPGIDPDVEIVLWTVGVVIFFLLIAAMVAAYNYRRKTNHYERVKDWWDVAKPVKTKHIITIQTGRIARRHQQPINNQPSTTPNPLLTIAPQTHSHSPIIIHSPVRTSVAPLDPMTPAKPYLPEPQYLPPINSPSRVDNSWIYQSGNHI